MDFSFQRSPLLWVIWGQRRTKIRVDNPRHIVWWCAYNCSQGINNAALGPSRQETAVYGSHSASPCLAQGTTSCLRQEGERFSFSLYLRITNIPFLPLPRLGEGVHVVKTDGLGSAKTLLSAPLGDGGKLGGCRAIKPHLIDTEIERGTVGLLSQSKHVNRPFFFDYHRPCVSFFFPFPLPLSFSLGQGVSNVSWSGCMERISVASML